MGANREGEGRRVFGRADADGGIASEWRASKDDRVTVG
jgi:hypothetical protein